MTDPHTARIREHVCPFCGAAVDRDIDGMYDCGTAWGADEYDREPECFMAEIEALRSRPSETMVAALMNTLNDGIEHFVKYRTEAYCRGIHNALEKIRDLVQRLLPECEDNNDS
jgi:hypothetical protein